VASGDEYLDDLPVPEGKVLEVHRISAWFTNCATTEPVRFYVKDGHEYLWIGDAKPLSTSGPCDTNLDAHLGEGKVLGCYSADVTTTETLHLVVTGCLWDLEDWRDVKAE